MSKADRPARGAHFRCAIYTRKSTDEGLEQEFNTLDAQREACEAYILSQKHSGWKALPDMYDDGGFSGGTMDRPALKRLLEDVASGKVNVVVVYKVDRLTRSLADFAKIVEILDAQDSSFVSVTQQFNTTTSMGRLTLNVLLSFAQFEREIAGERIRDKIAASKRKGMWMGGNVPLGYDAIDRKLVINEQEADTVRFVFRRYIELGTVLLLKEDLDRRGMVGKPRKHGDGRYIGKAFSRGALFLLLQNRINVGKIVHKGTAYPGLHEAIVDNELWNAAQEQLNSNRRVHNAQSRAKEPSLLSGLIVDSNTNPMTPSHAVKAGKRYRYYVSRTLMSGKCKANAKGQRIPAGEIETLVLDRLRAFFASHQDVGHVLASLNIAADEQLSAFERANQVSEGWRTQSATDQRSLVRSIVDQVAIGTDEITISVNRHHILAALEPDPNASPNDGRKKPDENPLVLKITASLRRAGKEVRLVIGDGKSDKIDPGLVKLIGESFALGDQLFSGDEDSIEAMSGHLNLGKGYLTARIRLTYLAPSIVRSILNGQHPVELTSKQLIKASQNLPYDWVEQQRFLGFAE